MLIATVEPWTTFAAWLNGMPAFARQFQTPCDSSCGVVRDLACRTRPVDSSKATRSVNVPPMSTATLRPLGAMPFKEVLLIQSIDRQPARARSAIWNLDDPGDCSWCGAPEGDHAGV